MKSIIQNEKRCFLCHATNTALDCHHVYPGCLRRNSERYGLTVYLCHDTCHEFGINSAHANPTVMKAIQSYAQKRAMLHYGWNLDEWRERFRKSYI